MAMMNEMEYRTIGSALAGGYRAAVYCRLSKDDDLQGESASIANQLHLCHGCVLLGLNSARRAFARPAVPARFRAGKRFPLQSGKKKKHTVYETIINGMLRIFCQSAPHRLGKEHGAHLGRQVQAAADEHAALAGAQRVLHGKRHVLPHGNLPAHLPCRRGQLPGR